MARRRASSLPGARGGRDTAAARAHEPGGRCDAPLVDRCLRTAAARFLRTSRLGVERRRLPDAVTPAVVTRSRDLSTHVDCVDAHRVDRDDHSALTWLVHVAQVDAAVLCADLI